MRFILIMLSMLCLALPAHAKEGIAVVVNDQAISTLDVKERLKLAMFSSGIKPAPGVQQKLLPQIMSVLIDEALYIQDGRKNKIYASEDEIENALRNLEKKNNLPQGSFRNFLASNGISPQTAVDKIAAQIVWQKILQHKIRSLAVITEKEVDEKIENIASHSGMTEIDLSEIVLPVRDAEEDHKIKETAENIVAQLREGADFASIASEFSRSTSASEGGRLGWVQQNQVANTLIPVVKELSIGGVSDPVRTADGYYIAKLHDRRAVINFKPGDTEVGLQQLYVPFKEEATIADKRQHAESLQARLKEVRGCPSFQKTAAEVGSTISSDMMMTQVKKLNSSIVEVVQDLQVGSVSPVVESTSGLHAFIVCERTEATTSFAKREKVKLMLVNKKVELQAKRYLRNLRRDAYIEVRL